MVFSEPEKLLLSSSSA